ncbi:MAG TPA: 1-(5-phosphoribosyl)-5-[(5-phosphoribosylamino)methylideneamino]imidazole-4-carboxamide isomerase [Coriobacteriia bacterium]|jgi:phosphoribosylformimino-5-aminoimidazole carboxamide ribotide isomerase
MIVFPAIDLLDGKVVRLRQGRLDAVTVYNESPVDQAARWAEQGAEWIHVVDLDGAVLGKPVNLRHIEAIIGAVPEVKVEAGGGIRTMETLERLVEAGVGRAVLGTTLITEPQLVAEACERYPEVVVAGIDARDGRVAIEGWRQGTEYGVLELVRDLEVLGVRRLAYTDISLDGMQTGVNYGAYRALANQIDIPVIASGGVATLEDIRDLASIGPRVEGVIVGRALYENAFTLAEALEAARGA